MSSSSSAAALSRTRSLRQPGIGTGTGIQRRGGGGGGGGDDREGLASNNGNSLNKGGAASAPAPTPATTDTRTNSPSRLPKFGSSTTAMPTTPTRARAGTTGARSGLPSTSTTTTTGTRRRPNSGIFGGLNRSNSLATRKPATQNDAAEQPEPSKIVRPTTTSSKLTRPKSISSAPKLSTTTSSRPSSSTTATTSTAKPQSPIRRTHTRTKSQATSLTSATTLRPPRPPSAGSVASTSTTTTTATAASKRPLGRSNTTTRPTRQDQPSASSSVNTSALNASSASVSTTTTINTRTTKPTTATDDAPRLRPAFTSYQQHYSPARNVAPKPLTSAFLAPPSPSKLPANVAISSETARLQTELLQLHLLHRDADAVTVSWHVSARDRLKMRFDALAAADKDVGNDEAALEEAHNIAALAAWAIDGEDDLENRIQALDAVVSGLWSLGEPGGRYARVVRRFEKWFDAMVQAVKARRRAGGVGALTEGNEVAFVSELDPAWKEEVALLARKLNGWQRQLSKLQLDSSKLDNELKQEQGHDQGGSSLARILAGCRAQTHDMLAELDLMEQMERDAINQEAAWIKRMNRDDDEADDTPRAGAIWRAF